MDELVRVRTYSDRTSAETVKGFLEAHGITAVLSTDDAGGVRPKLTLARGVKLWVRETDKAETLVPMLINFRESEIGAILVNHLRKKSWTRIELLQETEQRKETVGDAVEESCGFLTRLRKWLRGG